MKTCSKCGETKPLSDFNRHKKHRDGHTTICRSCTAAYRQLPEVKARGRVTRMESYYRNREREAGYNRSWRESHPAERSAATKRWVERNPEKARQLWAKNKARRRGADVAERIDRRYVYERDGGRCHICGRAVPRDDFHIDHLIPLARGGSHTLDNVALAHPRCNRERAAGRLPAQLLLVG